MHPVPSHRPGEPGVGPLFKNNLDRKMQNKEEFQTIFDKLKPILTSFADDLIVTTDEPGNYYLNTPFSEKYKK